MKGLKMDITTKELEIDPEKQKAFLAPIITGLLRYKATFLTCVIESSGEKEKYYSMGCHDTIESLLASLEGRPQELLARDEEFDNE